MKKKKTPKSPMQKVRKPVAPPTKVIPDKHKKKLEEALDTYELFWSVEDQDYLIRKVAKLKKAAKKIKQAMKRLKGK